MRAFIEMPGSQWMRSGNTMCVGVSLSVWRKLFDFEKNHTASNWFGAINWCVVTCVHYPCERNTDEMQWNWLDSIWHRTERFLYTCTHGWLDGQWCVYKSNGKQPEECLRLHLPQQSTLLWIPWSTDVIDSSRVFFKNKKSQWCVIV